MSHTIVDKRAKEQDDALITRGEWYVDGDGFLFAEGSSSECGSVRVDSDGNIFTYIKGIKDARIAEMDGITPVNVTITVEEIE